jgi:hypothetical protein
VAAAEAAMEALPISVDALDGPDVIYEAAAVMTKAEQPERALDLLATFFAGPGQETVAYLQVDPYFDGLRDQPGYTALLEGS